MRSVYPEEGFQNCSLGVLGKENRREEGISEAGGREDRRGAREAFLKDGGGDGGEE